MLRENALEALLNKHLCIEEVYAIFEHFKGDSGVEATIAMNLSLRTSVHNTSLEKSPTMSLLLEKLSTSEDMSVRWAVAKNPHTPVAVLVHLSHDPINLVRALVATNKTTPKLILQELFNDEKIVRDVLSGNPSTPLKYLLILCDDADAMVRLRVLENPSCTLSLCERLLNDEAQNVAQAAKITYQRLKNELA